MRLWALQKKHELALTSSGSILDVHVKQDCAHLPVKLYYVCDICQSIDVIYPPICA